MKGKCLSRLLANLDDEKKKLDAVIAWQLTDLSQVGVTLANRTLSYGGRGGGGGGLDRM